MERPPRKLLDQGGDAARPRRHSSSTEQTYISWIGLAPTGQPHFQQIGLPARLTAPS